MRQVDEKLMARLADYFTKGTDADYVADSIRQHLFYLLLEITKNYVPDENQLINNDLHNNVWQLFKLSEVLAPKYYLTEE
ncbi:MAG: hypothetical protein LBN95_07085 [Prevotellaceae bacterium]|jgi:hypothetical protein|nr:hypothetical protein [Prevotellaceae bacterium]